MGLLMAEMLEMPNNKGMTCLGQMETMTETMGFEENHLHGTYRKPSQNMSHIPSKSSKNLSRVLQPSLELALRQRLTPENSLHARQQSVPVPLGSPAM